MAIGVMKKEEIYRLLAAKLPGAYDYVEVPLHASDEPMVPIPSTKALWGRQIDTCMFAYTGQQIFVRQGVLQKLMQAAALLVSHDPDCALEVVYGYRPLEIQTRLFEEYKSKLQGRFERRECEKNDPK